MAIREYRLIDPNPKVNKEQLEHTESTFQDLWDLINPEPHHCLQIGGYTLLRSDIIQCESIVSVKTLDDKKQDIITSYPKHLYSKIKELDKKLNLTQPNLRKLKKEMEKSETKLLEINEQQKFLTEMANNIRKETDKKNFINKFRNRYSKMNECLCSDLQELNPETKKEFSNLLNDLKSRIDEVSTYLRVE